MEENKNLRLARQARAENNSEDAKLFYNKVREDDPENGEAKFFYAYLRKVVPDAPHEVLLVLDGSTGQNAFQQAKEFMRATDITALAVTKLDGSAKGGVVVGIVDQFRIPIKFVGIGEGIDDLKVFNKREFVGSLFSKDDIA